MSQAKPLHSTAINDARYDEEESCWIRFVDARQRIESRKFPAATDFLRWAKLFLADERTQRFSFDKIELNAIFTLLARTETKHGAVEWQEMLFWRLAKALGLSRKEALAQVPDGRFRGES